VEPEVQTSVAEGGVGGYVMVMVMAVAMVMVTMVMVMVTMTMTATKAAKGYKRGAPKTSSSD